MNNSKFAELKSDILSYYNSYYIDTSNNNIVLQNALECFNDLTVYHNTVSDGHILNDFKDEYGDQLLKDSSIKKLLNWLKDEDIYYLFEDDLLINKGADYYASKNACLFYTQEESEECFGSWLNGDKLTELQKHTIENLLSSYINDEQSYLYIHGISFEFIIPKKAILREYISYIKANK
jgi:hypothetical protein